MAEKFSEYVPPQTENPWKKYLTHGLLFVLTFLTTTLAGVQWLNNNPLELANFSLGLTYSILILLMLGAHEFGHYFAARHHHVDATLPFFVPFPSFFGFNPFGTLGAVIRIRSTIPSRKVLFDIGAAGPLAGFVVSLLILIVGFMNLPGKEYLYTIHPEYATLTAVPEGGIRFGETLLFAGLAEIFAPAGSFMPPMNEVYHYPFLCVGWFGLFVTALNLLPIGQLDGGHISYAMFGDRHHIIAQAVFVTLVVIGLLGLLPLVGIDFPYGYYPWLVWVFILTIMMRRSIMSRPPMPDETELDPARRAIGWLCYAIFVTSFSLAPITASAPEVLF